MGYINKNKTKRKKEEAEINEMTQMVHSFFDILEECMNLLPLKTIDAERFQSILFY